MTVILSKDERSREAESEAAVEGSRQCLLYHAVSRHFNVAAGPATSTARPSPLRFGQLLIANCYLPFLFQLIAEC